MPRKTEKVASLAPDTQDPDIHQYIFIKGARANNLKNIDLAIPRNQLVVVTGLSGSGKSSITMDTLYAEGQRRYVESLSSYARQFLNRMKKPDVDYIRGICPAIAIEQKVTTSNARSTVGTMTEVYDFLRLLYARIGKTYSPVSGEVVKKHEVSDVVDFILSQPDGARAHLFIPLQQKYVDRTFEQELNVLLQKGYTRIWREGNLEQIDELLATLKKTELNKKISSLANKDVRVLIDRFAIQQEDTENTKRIADSVLTAFAESEGDCIVAIVDGKTMPFNNRFELDGVRFLEPSPQLFNFNNSLGACPTCEGYGRVMGIDEDKVIPDKTKSVYDGAIAPWSGEKGQTWLKELLKHAHKFDFPVHKAYQDLSRDQRRLLWKGNDYFYGIDAYFEDLESKTYKIQNRVMLSRYRGKTSCPTCFGGRLRPEAMYVRIHEKDITELVEMPIEHLRTWFQELALNDYDRSVSRRLLLEVENRLRFMTEVGLGYLTLNRLSNSLSGGETQRLNLTRTLGSNLTSSMYLLDEPSIGLHPRDTDRLVTVLRNLRDLGNTVVVVEHEEEIIRNADYLVDIGPGAGVHGGEVIYAGPFNEISKAAPESLTTAYLEGRKSIEVPKVRRNFTRQINIKGARQHNLKNFDVTIPLNCMTVVTGVSGSGKTTLVKQILYPALMKMLNQPLPQAAGAHDELSGSWKTITQVEMINQSPIGKSSRSNPVTYIKAYDGIRKLMSEQQLSKIRGFTPGHFSFNVEGGRCETCKGEGEIVVEMQFLADVKLECEECKGRRFRNEILEVEYKGKNINDILNLSIEDGIAFFSDQRDIRERLQCLADVGLEYVKLGQSSSTLSGGEAQRVKLAFYLSKEGSGGNLFFIFDEPTTGLHFHDVRKLLNALNALVEKGHTVLVVEHNMELIKCADWLIDLGPEGGQAGGHLLYQGVPEGIGKVKESYTGTYLKDKFNTKAPRK